MATVTGMTAEKIQELLDSTIESVRVDSNGQLIYKNRAGVETNTGPIVSPTVAAEKAWPVGSIFISTVPTNPATMIGVGTWVRFAQGRTLVGLDEAQTEFDTVLEQGGEKTHLLSTAEMPSHTHPQIITANDNSGVTPGASMLRDFYSTGTNLGRYPQGTTTDPAGGSQAHNNLQPYIVTYMWRRTA